MPVKYVAYYPNTVQGQAILDTIARTRRVLRYRDHDKVYERIARGMPYYELEKIESVTPLNPHLLNGESQRIEKCGLKNMLIRGECISACAYLKDKNIKVDLVYIDPPFASGADYAKKVYLRKNPKVAEAIAQAEEELDLEELRTFEEKMYGDIWNKEDYLNWMYENLTAIKSVMNETGSIYVHLDWHIGHYVKVLMDEVFGEDNFKNEIAWCYSGGAIPVDRFPKKHETIFWYSKSNEEWFYIPEYRDYSKKTQQRGRTRVKGSDAKLREEGTPINDWWVDIAPVTSPTDYEKMYYVTQKPEVLLERIIKASSKEGMLIADFFGGSGVAAKVSHDLKRRFIHCDVGIHSIQTTRDRLVAAGAEFDIYDIQDGVSLFRNPVQTMDKLKSLIPGLKNDASLDSFWEGGIQDSKLGFVPVYIPNLLDHSSKVLDIPLINRVINEAILDLPEGTKQVIVYYVDIENETELRRFISEYNATGIDIMLKDLKIVLDDVVINDEIAYKIKESMTGFEIEIVSFTSDRLIQKIDTYNQKKFLLCSKEELSAENGKENSEKPFVPISISQHGLELIELICLDCTNKSGIWKSDFELKIDKNGFVVLNGKKTKNFWNSKIISEKRPLRMKIRNIAGDESVILL